MLHHKQQWNTLFQSTHNSQVCVCVCVSGRCCCVFIYENNFNGEDLLLILLLRLLFSFSYSSALLCRWTFILILTFLCFIDVLLLSWTYYTCTHTHTRALPDGFCCVLSQCYHLSLLIFHHLHFLFSWKIVFATMATDMLCVCVRSSLQHCLSYIAMFKWNFIYSFTRTRYIAKTLEQWDKH